MTVVGAHQADAEVEFQVQVAGDAAGIAITQSGGDEKLALVAFLFPLQVVLAAPRIQTQKMSGQHLTMGTFPQPITPFQSTGKHLKTVFITVQLPPGEHIFAVQRPAFADGEFDLDVGHQGSVEQQVCFQGKQGATVSTNGQG